MHGALRLAKIDRLPVARAQHHRARRFDGLETSIKGAKGVLLNITGGANLGLFEINEASTLVQESCDEEANIIFGATIKEELGDELVITVISTGFDEN
ncbi:MAG TPA: hypothetical protein VLT84_00360, partial [Acidobacteriota bacterium]|nr:hypothetical protein [Acidobacteriota bacterium]